MNDFFIQKAVSKKMGFITDNELPKVISENPMQGLLIRCGGGRFITQAQDAKHFIDIIERDKTDFIRDVSIVKEQQ